MHIPIFKYLAKFIGIIIVIYNIIGIAIAIYSDTVAEFFDTYAISWVFMWLMYWFFVLEIKELEESYKSNSPTIKTTVKPDSPPTKIEQQPQRFNKVETVEPILPITKSE